MSVADRQVANDILELALERRECREGAKDMLGECAEGPGVVRGDRSTSSPNQLVRSSWNWNRPTSANSSWSLVSAAASIISGGMNGKRTVM
jgi:hypothetical protein